MEQEKQKYWLYFIPSGLVLFVYPAVLIANIMSFAAESSGDESGLVMLIVRSFLWVSTLYPVTYLVSIIMYVKSKDTEKKASIAKWPYYHLGLAVALFIFWAAFGN